MSKPVAGLDTTTINRFASLQGSGAPLLDRFKSVFSVRLTEMNVGEVIATPTVSQRALLLRTCHDLIKCGDVILPHQEIIAIHIREFESGREYDWRQVSIQFPDCEMALESSFDLLASDGDLSAAQLEHSRSAADEFEAIYERARPEFDKLFTENRESRPPTTAALVSALQVEGGAFWTIAADLYARVAGRTPGETTIRRFVALCPPFRALLMALCVAQHDRCDRNLSPAKLEKLAKRSDLFMATFLPYWDEFISDDRDQLRCFREVILLAGLNTRALWYGQLDQRLSQN